MFYNVLHCFEGILSSLPKTSLSLCAVRTEPTFSKSAFDIQQVIKPYLKKDPDSAPI